MDEKEQKQLLMDLDVVMRSSDCPYIVQFYGALFREVRQTNAPKSRLWLIKLPMSVFFSLLCSQLLFNSQNK